MHYNQEKSQECYKSFRRLNFLMKGSATMNELFLHVVSLGFVSKDSLDSKGRLHVTLLVFHPMRKK